MGRIHQRSLITAKTADVDAEENKDPLWDRCSLNRPAELKDVTKIPLPHLFITSQHKPGELYQLKKIKLVVFFIISDHSCLSRFPCCDIVFFRRLGLRDGLPGGAVVVFHIFG